MSLQEIQERLCARGVGPELQELQAPLRVS